MDILRPGAYCIRAYLSILKIILNSTSSTILLRVINVYNYKRMDFLVDYSILNDVNSTIVHRSLPKVSKL